MVFSVDLERLRGQPAWAAGLASLSKDRKRWLDGLTASTGLDLTKQVRRVLVALPAERQRDDRFVLIADTDRLDETRVTAWLRERLRNKADVVIRDNSKIILSQGDWTSATKALATSTRRMPNATDNPEMLRLCTRAATKHDLWFAAAVPMSVRGGLMQEQSLADVASMARVWGAIDLDGLSGTNSGAHAEAVAELSSTADATELVHRLGVYLNQAKRHPDMLVHGLAPYLEAVRLSSQGASVHLSLDVSGAQLSECIERMEALAHGAWTK